MFRLTLLLAFIGFVLAGFLTASEKKAVMNDHDENMPDTLMIDQVMIEKGEKVSLAVSFFNDEELAALTIPLGIVGDMYKFDSVSFVGSRIEYIKMKPVTIAENLTDVVFGAICMTEGYIQPGKGLMATLYLSPKNSSKSQSCEIDTITMGPASVLYTKTNSASFIPEFRKGKIALKSAVEEKPKVEAAEKKDE
jgi:hypothetical protein